MCGYAHLESLTRAFSNLNFRHVSTTQNVARFVSLFRKTHQRNNTLPNLAGKSRVPNEAEILT